MNSTQDLLKNLPSIDTLLHEQIAKNWLDIYDRSFITKLLRDSVHGFREKLQATGSPTIELEHLTDSILEEAKSRLDSFFDSRLKRVVNGTGVILHTNLGRAPLAPEVSKKFGELTENYCSVEFNLETGKRGERTSIVEHLITELSGAESAAVVNNNAAAVLLTLNSIADGKEVIISRGQLIEIGGAFRIPEVMAQSGAKMVEIGTTNKTHLRDYEHAITDQTGAIMVAHPSNYRVLGFTQDVPMEKLVPLARTHGIPIIYDLGGGVFIDLEKYGLPHEPVVSRNIKRGVDVVTFSGDKILGGPQAGIIAGKRIYLQKIRKNHLLRALRLDKLILAALEETLKLYFQKDFVQKVPSLRMLTEPLSAQKQRAETLLSSLSNEVFESGSFDIVIGSSQVGSGAIPLEELKSFVLGISHIRLTPNELAKSFREYSPPIIGYIRDEKFYLNMRTIRDSECPILKEAIESIFLRQT
ncbi:MAG: L-seryl-tRNA(Sec) selenium transferase [Calditrichaeota bacterium]|nr:L-seryl-tRNA(Sec) selenium transferase [Calditrichota bacterium]